LLYSEFLASLATTKRTVTSSSVGYIHPEMAPSLPRRDDTPSQQPSTSLFAIIIPLAIFLIIINLVVIRRLVNRRIIAKGDDSIDSFPWSWLACCVIRSRDRTPSTLDRWYNNGTVIERYPREDVCGVGNKRHLVYEGVPRPPQDEKHGKEAYDVHGRQTETKMLDMRTQRGQRFNQSLGHWVGHGLERDMAMSEAAVPLEAHCRGRR
jgi:hypothetical protein